MMRLCCRASDEEPPPLLLPLLDHDVEIVAFTGLAGAGKDTAADFLVEDGFVKLAFADPLKEGVHCLFGIPAEHLNDPVKKEEVDPEWGLSPRRLMQWLGTDVLRKEIDDNFFLTSMAKRIRASGAKRVVIPDCRFDIEADFVRRYGGRVFRVYRNGYSSITNGVARKHASESGVSGKYVEKTLLNSGSPADLGELVRAQLARTAGQGARPARASSR